jgi:hypothetical protein
MTHETLKETAEKLPSLVATAEAAFAKLKANAQQIESAAVSAGNSRHAEVVEEMTEKVNDVTSVLETIIAAAAPKEILEAQDPSQDKAIDEV